MSNIPKQSTWLPKIGFSEDADADTLWSVLNGWTVSITVDNGGDRYDTFVGVVEYRDKRRTHDLWCEDLDAWLSFDLDEEAGRERIINITVL